MHLLALAAHAGAFFHWGVFNVSWTNLTIIGLMLLAFVLALLLPFPRDRR
jgi:hypothetical protein